MSEKNYKSHAVNDIKLPRLFNNNLKPSKQLMMPFPSTIPSKEELENRITMAAIQNSQQASIKIQNDLIPYSLETFCESTKDYLKDENSIRKSKLVQTEFGKYVFINEHGILLNKYGPFWPKTHKIIHQLPKFILKCDVNKEFYTNKDSIATQINSQYTADWKNYTVVFDCHKSPRIQEPIIFSQRYSPTLVFESRFESGNLRQARRV